MHSVHTNMCGAITVLEMKLTNLKLSYENTDLVDGTLEGVKN